MHPLDGLRRRHFCKRGGVRNFRPHVLSMRPRNVFRRLQPSSLFKVAQLHRRGLRRDERDVIDREDLRSMWTWDVLFTRKYGRLFKVAQLHRGELRRGKRFCNDRQDLRSMWTWDLLFA